MADLQALLHDEIDEQEALANQASAIVESAIGELRRIFDEVDGSPVAAMEMLAQLVAVDLDALTTKAVQRGALAGALRVEEAGSDGDHEDADD